MATDKIGIRVDTAANWTSANPTLESGEQGHESDTGRRKIGNGSTAWTSLGYIGGVGDTPESDNMPTVSGTPIIGSGSNSFGEWTRWADGTQYTGKELNVDCNGASSGSGTWAKLFIDTNISITLNLNLSTADFSRIKSMSEIGTTASSASAFNYAKAGGNDYTGVQPVYFGAVGRWL